MKDWSKEESDTVYEYVNDCYKSLSLLHRHKLNPVAFTAAAIKSLNLRSDRRVAAVRKILADKFSEK